MKSITAMAVLALASTASAFPSLRSWRFGKRQTLAQMTDVDILNYALTLEHLEATFYRQGLANFTQAAFATAGFDSTFYANIQEIAKHEAAHVDFLTTALKAAGASPVQECTYAFGIASVTQFVATASIFEGIGTSAYLGAAKQIANKAYLTAAGSILTVEARHSAYLRASLSESPFPQTQDDPLSPDEVHTMAHGFIVSCPTGNPTFPVRAFPGISITTAAPMVAGQLLNVQTTDSILRPADPKAQLFAAFITAVGPQWTPLMPSGDGINFQVTVPTGVYGQSYLLLNECNTTVTDMTVVAGPTFIEISGAS